MTLSLRALSDVDIQHKRVLIRVDFNVPMEGGNISNDARMRAALPTLQFAIKKGAKILVLSHLGRPKEGEYDSQFSLAPIATHLSALLGQPVRLIKDWIQGVDLAPGEIALAENVRFLPGEKANDEALAKKMAALCDVFVMEAFGAAHRAHASTYGVACFSPLVCAGPLVLAEVAALEKALAQPKRPLVAIIGGSKVSTKLTVLEQLVNKVDYLIVGGGIANTFLKANGYAVGKSLYEPDLLSIAQELHTTLQNRNAFLPLPEDVVITDSISVDATDTMCKITEVPENKMIVDIGLLTAKHYAELIADAGTIIWNGPVGVFEMPAFSAGTKAIAQAIARSHAYSLAGGGDTIAAIEQFHIENDIDYISTGGGAFLEFLGGAEFPALSILQTK